MVLSNEKVVIINGKRFIVGSSKIKPTKCHDYNNPKRKKLLSKDEREKEEDEKKIEKIEKIEKKILSRQSKRQSRKKREIS
jgi:hypothetical protein